MSDAISAALFGVSAGAAIVAMLLMARHWNIAFAFRAGVALFALIAFVAVANVATLVLDRPPPWVIALSGLLSASLFPWAWLYVRDLVSDVPRPFVRRDLWHFAVPAAFTPFVAWATVLSESAEDSLWGIGPMTAESTAFAIFGLVLTVLWSIQITIYTAKMFFSLHRLPARLRNVFSDVVERDLLWLRIILFVFIAHTPVVVAENIGVIEMPEVVFAVFASVLTTLFAGWAANQMPVFQLSPETSARAVVQESELATSEKYARSLLDDDRLARIADRLENAFAVDKLHLVPNISLAKLSERTGVSENHLSQTFTRRFEKSFFDYVNAKRVDEAKKIIAETDASIADIGVDVGFNSRSVFYKAFKAETGTTPAAYRDLLRQAAESRSL